MPFPWCVQQELSHHFPWRFLVCFVPLSCVCRACMNHVCREGIGSIYHGICICGGAFGPRGWCEMASHGHVYLLQLLLFLSGSLEANKPFPHCVVPRNKNLTWKSMPEMVFCFAHSANHHTADFFWLNKCVAFCVVKQSC